MRGARFLTSRLSDRDPNRVRAAIYGLSLRRHDPRTVPLLLRHFHDEPAGVLAEVIDGLTHNRYRKAVGRILPLCTHRNPQIVGAALRYMSAVARKEAPALLLHALKHRHFSVRENACDELDELGFTDAIPALEPLLKDPHKDVRQAARVAVRNLRIRRRVVQLRGGISNLRDRT